MLLCMCVCVGIVCLVNRDGRTALHRAVEGNQHRNVPLLLQADPNITNIQDKNGQTALHLACHFSRSKCIRALFVSPLPYYILFVSDRSYLI